MNVRQLHGIFKLLDCFDFPVYYKAIPRFTFITNDVMLTHHSNGLELVKTNNHGKYLALRDDECILNFHDMDRRHYLLDDSIPSYLLNITTFDGINAIILKALEINDVNVNWIKTSFMYTKTVCYDMYVKSMKGLQIKDYIRDREKFNKMFMRSKFVMDNLLSNWEDVPDGIRISVEINEHEEVFNFHIMLDNVDTIVKQISRKAPEFLPTVFIFKDYQKIPPYILNVVTDDILSRYYDHLKIDDQYALNCIEHSCRFKETYLECSKHDLKIVKEDNPYDSNSLKRHYQLYGNPVIENLEDIGK